jgi:glycosyltransferase involved in cell wall biosynthesis
VLEAWACGTPVIVTDRCGISEYAKKAGCVVYLIYVSFIRLFFVCSKNRDWREKASKLGRELVLREFSWDRIIDQLEVLCFEQSKQ